MRYFVTGATGLIGRHLVERLLARGGTVHALILPADAVLLEHLRSRWGADGEQVVALTGDVTQPWLGLDPDGLAALDGVDHVFHLAALRDPAADPVRLRAVNTEGTQHAIRTAEKVGAGRFHHVSTTGVAGRYPGRFGEEMLLEARGLQHLYFRTKHRAEQAIREECGVPWRVYRPGTVVGHSQTGEMVRIDGPYHLFPAIKRLAALPEWLPLVGVDGGRLHLVPVDYVADAIDHIAHLDGWDGCTFHLVDRDPPTLGRVLNAMSRAAGGPQFAARLDARALRVVPASVRTLVGALPPVHRTRNTVLHGLGIPRQTLTSLMDTTRFETENTREALSGTAISIPPIESYAGALWRYWQAELEQPIRGVLGARDHFRGRIALVTGASSGIGLETAKVLAARGCTVILVALYADELEPVRAELADMGADVHAYAANLADLADVDRVISEILIAHGRVDILVNNAGRSIRRSIAYAYDRMHDLQRTVQLNYFGAARMILGVLPGMRERRYGHIVNISSIGVQTNQPRFSAYVGSKAALDAFSRSLAAEVADDGVSFTTIYMPLVRTPMIAPTSHYRYFPTLSAEQAAGLVVRAIAGRPTRIASTLGRVGEVAHALAPKSTETILNLMYHLEPESPQARGEEYEERIPDFGVQRRELRYLFGGIRW
jgi:NAD(P)-dependent dehydrogenase (short-subunit alcohol dehydrogenase family)